MKINEFLEDNSGGLSSLRLSMLLWSIGALIVWVYLSMLNKTISPIPESVIILILGITSTKSIQRFGEKSENETKQ